MSIAVGMCQKVQMNPINLFCLSVTQSKHAVQVACLLFSNGFRMNGSAVPVPLGVDHNGFDIDVKAEAGFVFLFVVVLDLLFCPFVSVASTVAVAIG
jgi:hypothetical protein